MMMTCSICLCLAMIVIQEPEPKEAPQEPTHRPVPHSIDPRVPVFAGAITDSDPRAKVLELERRLRELEARLEDGRPGLNLARTTLARVSASSVNGDRAADDPYYGILNAFDDGTGREVRGNVYSSWMPSNRGEPWIDVEFDEPLVVHTVQVDGQCSFSAQLIRENGEELLTRSVTERVRLEEPLSGVVRVRIRFGASSVQLLGSVDVREVRVLGQVPEDVAFEQGAPRLRLNAQGAEAIARGDWERWQNEVLGDLRATTIRDSDGTWIVTLRSGGRDVMRVTTDGKKKTVEPLIELVPIER
ncbi:MAG: hypothetical protein RL885_21510 [Planctomycetota bacterium]